MMMVQEFITSVLSMTIRTERELVVAGIRYVRDFLHQQHVGKFSLVEIASGDDSDYWARHELLVALDNQLQTLIDEGEL